MQKIVHHVLSDYQESIALGQTTQLQLELVQQDTTAQLVLHLQLKILLLPDTMLLLDLILLFLAQEAHINLQHFKQHA